MSASNHEADSAIRDLQARAYRDGGVFWIDQGTLGIFEPTAAQQVSALNYHDLTLPERLCDLVRGRKSDPVSWTQVRGAWASQMRRLTDSEAVEQLAHRMCALLDERLDRPRDLMWAAQEVTTRALVPSVITGLSKEDSARVLRDQTVKLEGQLTRTIRHPIWWAGRSTLAQISAGLVVRRELGGRAKGRRQRQLDLTDPLVDMLPVLGMDRASYAATTALTALSGPPVAVAACLLFELTHQPDWARRVTDELSSISLPAFCRAPTTRVPVTHRFVKETLRLWSSPAFIGRVARTAIDLGQAHLEAGQEFEVSPFILHRDPRHWKDPDSFNPDRWREEIDHGNWYVPFGWSPMSCVGATLGTIQLQLLCYLMCTRYRVDLPKTDASWIETSGVSLPIDFRGTITRR